MNIIWLSSKIISQWIIQLFSLKISLKKYRGLLFFATVCRTKNPLLSVVVRHHILEGSQLVGQSLNQLVCQSISLSVNQSVSGSFHQVSKNITAPGRWELDDKQSVILHAKETKSELTSLVNSNVLEIFREKT